MTAGFEHLIIRPMRKTRLATVPRKPMAARPRATTISATDAARRFSDVLNRVHYRGEAFVVERAGEPVCEIVPARRPGLRVADLRAVLRSLPEVDDGYWDAVEDAARNQPTVQSSPWER